MSNFFNNGIVQGVLATLILVIILGILGWLNFKIDKKIVTKFLANSGVESRDTYNTTHAISSAINLSEQRIRKVCNKSPRIRKNQKEEKESWKLSR
jgi:hypothetical protein